MSQQAKTFLLKLSSKNNPNQTTASASTTKEDEQFTRYFISFLVECGLMMIIRSEDGNLKQVLQEKQRLEESLKRAKKNLEDVVEEIVLSENEV